MTGERAPAPDEPQAPRDEITGVREETDRPWPWLVLIAVLIALLPLVLSVLLPRQGVR